MSNTCEHTHYKAHISPKKSPCVAFPPLKTRTVKQQLKMTTVTPNSGGNRRLRLRLSLIQVSSTPVRHLTALVTSRSFQARLLVTLLLQPIPTRLSVDAFVVTFDTFESVAATMQLIDPYERYNSFERRECI